ncbi:unnamed protein product [Polarella glacialis]|uniref:Uncharacterized protein n=1 Tax=Polarella glacialis TaxID=89957 RepID=A0A813GL18_POLGL|nr:unnamed protein product [Polarella glacialis]
MVASLGTAGFLNYGHFCLFNSLNARCCSHNLHTGLSQMRGLFCVAAGQRMRQQKHFAASIAAFMLATRELVLKLLAQIVAQASTPQFPRATCTMQNCIANSATPTCHSHIAQLHG